MPSYAFERAGSDLAEINTSVVSLSVDDPTTQELIDKHHLTFPVGHSAALTSCRT